MLEVTEKASEMIKKFLEGREGAKSVRILVTEGGWRGPYLVLAIDEKKETDEVLTEKGATFVIDKELLERSKPIQIDYVLNDMGGGYILKSNLLKAYNEACECIREKC